MMENHKRLCTDDGEPRGTMYRFWRTMMGPADMTENHEGRCREDGEP